MRNLNINQTGTLKMASHAPESTLIFAVGPVHLCADMRRVDAVLELQPLSVIPMAADYILGGFWYMGEFVPVVNTRYKFALPEPDVNAAQTLITTRIDGDLFAFRVDRVEGSTESRQFNWQSLPRLGSGVFLHALFSHDNNENTIILNTDLARLKDAPQLNITTFVAGLKKAGQTKTIPEATSELTPGTATKTTPTEHTPRHTVERLNKMETRQHPAVSPASYREARHQNEPQTRRTETIQTETMQTETIQTETKITPHANFKHDKIFSAAQTGKNSTSRAGDNISTDTQSKQRRHTEKDQDSLAAITRRTTNHDTTKQPEQNLEVQRNEVQCNEAQYNETTGAGNFAMFILVLSILGALVSYTFWPATWPTEKQPREETQADNNTLVAQKHVAAVTPSGQTGDAGDAGENLKKATRPAAIKQKNSTIIDLQEHEIIIERTSPQKPARQSTHKARPSVLLFEHTVVKGDTLWHIATTYLDDPYQYPELAKLSNIADPDLIYPGDIVKMKRKTGNLTTR